MAMKNRNHVQLVSIITALLLLVVNVACAVQPGNDPTSVDPVTNVVLNDIWDLLSGELKGVVSFSNVNTAIQEVNSGISDKVDALLDEINEILLTSYRDSSKEYRRGCNFLQISV